MAFTNFSNLMKCEPLRTLAFGAIDVGYNEIGVPYLHPIRAYFLQNLTDVLLDFSFDGINDHLVLGAGGTFSFDISANKSTACNTYFGQGMSTFVKENGTPTMGAVYLTVFYGSVNNN